MFPIGYEWQTILLYSVVGLVASLILWRWHMSRQDAFVDFSLVGLIADHVDGKWKLSSSKFQEFGAFVIFSLGVIVCMIRGSVPAEFVGLLTLYAGVFVIRRVVGQQIHTTAEREVKVEAMKQGLDPVDFSQRQPAEPKRPQRTSILGNPIE